SSPREAGGGSCGASSTKRGQRAGRLDNFHFSTSTNRPPVGARGFGFENVFPLKWSESGGVIARGRYETRIVRDANVSAGGRGMPLAGGDAPDLVFIDPPYEIVSEIAPALFARLAEALAAKPEALVVFELPGELDLAPPGWELVKRLGKGARQPTVAFFRANQ